MLSRLLYIIYLWSYLRIIPYLYLPLARNSTPMFSNADVTTSAFKRCASKQLLAYSVERIRSGYRSFIGSRESNPAMRVMLGI